MFQATRISGLYSRKHEYDRGKVHVTFVVDELGFIQAVIPALRLIPNSNIPTTQHSVHIYLATTSYNISNRQCREITQFKLKKNYLRLNR
jgi:hypothetical protein